ncbi:FG-GAP-like repeat-containing protein [Candidatus Cyanaurora vandensis]|uniref:FG-GAP-like repeat-containing protein n=1 Tax=Candidatus Cyanaurora vandensis TaxID=2714958 RepID=UPI00257C33CF|nr:FG-GAP-like repeat-containing protein [Candidatus Cyanaurora vandensis]
MLTARNFTKLSLALLAVPFLLWAPVQARPIPENLGSGLERLVQWQLNGLPADPEEARLAEGFRTLAQRDAQGRVLVNIHLDGKQKLPQLKRNVQGLGLKVVAESATYRKGVLSAYLPLEQAVTVARLAGVRSVTLVPKPKTNVGLTTAQGTVVHRADRLNTLGFTGAGVTVGVLSDSYNTNTTKTGSVLIKAENDVASGDLPGTGNPLGNTTPVVVLQEQPGGTDEGRGMLQIIHDTAPKAKLCFATAFVSDVGFAQNILNLADPALGCGAHVVVDDVIYFAEPMFSDGIIAQAAQQVVDQGASYFSSAGNRASAEGYSSTIRLVDNATVRAGLPGENLNFTNVPAGLTAGGFHDFDPGPAVVMSQAMSVGGLPETVTISFQWNDPYDVGGITTDYNFLVFRANGSYVGSLSGTANNFATDQSLELIALTGGLNPRSLTKYQIVIARASNDTPVPVADQVRYVISSSLGTTTIDEFISYTTPITYGHSAAAGANSVAAYAYDSDFTGPDFTPVVEGFTSPGPVPIYFDRAGNRLATPEVRQKPDMAAVDGLNTTFFPPGGLNLTDAEGDGFPNFFGTSASAPQAAALAALLLDKANGALTPAQVKRYLQGSGPIHDLSPSFSEAVATVGGTTVRVTATGDGSNFAAADPNFFKISFTGTAGQELTDFSLNLTPSGLTFDTNADTGLPFTTGVIVGDVGVTGGLLAPSPSPELDLAFISFDPSDSVAFGVDRDVAAVNSGGNSADALVGATFTATVTGLGVLTGTFIDVTGKGFSILDGYGLVDAPDALVSVPPFAVRAATWQLVGTGDLNSDGQKDLLWRNYTTGENEVWFFDGYTYQSAAPLPSVTDTTWHLVGAADLTNDGQADLLWRNYQTGANAVWQMDGTTYEEAFFIGDVTDPEWQLVGTADFTSDGKTDLIWRNYQTGENAIWRMDGYTYQEAYLIGAVTDPRQQLIGAGDFTGDGQPDLLWRDTTTGANYVWQLVGYTYNATLALNAVADLDWQLVGTADFSNDGKTDLLWRNVATGEDAFWLLDGLTFVSPITLGTRSAQ